MFLWYLKAFAHKGFNERVKLKNHLPISHSDQFKVPERERERERESSKNLFEDSGADDGGVSLSSQFFAKCKKLLHHHSLCCRDRLWNTPDDNDLMF